MINILLDLDETIISATQISKKNGYRYTFENGNYKIYERPYLDEFLTFIFDNFNVSIFTASTKDYCLNIVNNSILKNHPERKIDYI